jgi:hypothetical protein
VKRKEGPMLSSVANRWGEMNSKCHFMDVVTLTKLV